MHESTCLSFAVARGGAPKLGLSNEAFLEIVEQAFERWQTVDCGHGQTPGLYVQSAGIVNAPDAFYCEEPTFNLGVWSFDQTWDLGKNAVGNTGAIFDQTTGKIFDVDVELNLEKIATDYPVEDRHDVLLSIATHEAGHFLGLAHSNQQTAIMFERYSDAELIGRPLAPDDIDGICEIFPPEFAPTRCPKTKVEDAAVDREACEEATELMYQDSEQPSDSCALTASVRRTQHGRAWTHLFAALSVVSVIRRRSKFRS